MYIYVCIYIHTYVHIICISGIYENVNSVYDGRFGRFFGFHCAYLSTLFEILTG